MPLVENHCSGNTLSKGESIALQRAKFGSGSVGGGGSAKKSYFLVMKLKGRIHEGSDN